MESLPQELYVLIAKRVFEDTPRPPTLKFSLSRVSKRWFETLHSNDVQKPWLSSQIQESLPRRLSVPWFLKVFTQNNRICNTLALQVAIMCLLREKGARPRSKKAMESVIRACLYLMAFITRNCRKNYLNATSTFRTLFRFVSCHQTDSSQPLIRCHAVEILSWIAQFLPDLFSEAFYHWHEFITTSDDVKLILFAALRSKKFSIVHELLAQQSIRELAKQIKWSRRLLRVVYYHIPRVNVPERDRDKRVFDLDIWSPQYQAEAEARRRLSSLSAEGLIFFTFWFKEIRTPHHFVVEASSFLTPSLISGQLPCHILRRWLKICPEVWPLQPTEVQSRYLQNVIDTHICRRPLMALMRDLWMCDYKVSLEIYVSLLDRAKRSQDEAWYQRLLNRMPYATLPADLPFPLLLCRLALNIIKLGLYIVIFVPLLIVAWMSLILSPLKSYIFMTWAFTPLIWTTCIERVNMDIWALRRIAMRLLGNVQRRSFQS